MDTPVINQRIESIAKGLQDLINSNIEFRIIEENNFWSDDIILSVPDPENIFIDDPLGFTLLDISQYPCIYIFPAKGKRSDNFTKAYQLEVTGFIREEDASQIVKKNLRFAEVVNSIIESDLTVGGICGGGIVGEVNYSQVLTDSEEFFIAFQIDVAYYGN